MPLHPIRFRHRFAGRVSAAAYWLGAWVAACVPRSLATALGRGVGEACCAAQPDRRRTLVANWRRLGAVGARRRPPSPRLAFARFGGELVETLRLLSARPAEVMARVEFVHLAPLEAAAQAAKPVLVSVHSGNWEWAGAALALRGHRVAALARPHRGPVERFFRALRRRFGVATRCRARVAAREAAWLTMFVDRGTPSASRTARRAAALAARAGRPLAACWVESLPGAGYRVTFGPLLRPGRTAHERRAAARAALRFLQTRLERAPEQWFAFEPLSGLPLGGAA